MRFKGYLQRGYKERNKIVKPASKKSRIILDNYFKKRTFFIVFLYLRKDYYTETIINQINFQS